MQRARQQTGFSLVETLVVAAVAALVFGALFVSFDYTLELISNTRARLSAVSLANERMEYFRSLPYDDVGTIAGIPPGTIPQNSTTTFNNILFYERVLVEYVDDPADGQDTATTSDGNAIPNDYKRVKVEYSWNVDGATSTLALISNIVPRSIESNIGGGTVRITVLNANTALLPGAEVRLWNDTTTSTIDVTRTTNASGVALFSGAPAAGNYQVSVTANIGGEQYSTDGTYLATTSNPTPIVGPFAVVEADVSSLTFQIGDLSDINLFTRSAIVVGSYEDTFPNLDAIATSSNVDTALNALVLSDTLGVYAPVGVAYLDAVAPATLQNWETLRIGAELPSGDTTYRVQFFTGTTSAYVLIPDGDLPGNSSGFTDSLIDLTALDVATYSSLTVGLTLETTDTSETPSIDEVALYWRESETVLPSVTLTVHGDKTIGTSATAEPIYKATSTIVTNGAGSATVSEMEFDTYTITPPTAYDIAATCPAHPFVHAAGVDSEVTVVLAGAQDHTVRVQVVDALGRSIPGATVTLERGAYDVTIDTGVCGQAFFSGGLTDAADYRLEVAAPGYVTAVSDPFAVSGDVVQLVTLLSL